MGTSPNATAPSAGSTERFQFVTPSRLEYRDAAKAFLSYVCEQLAKRDALPTDLGHRVVSAFVEAYTNAVIHAYKRQPTGEVEVHLEIAPDKLRLAVIDQGAAFVMEKVPEPDLDALPEGGMGLFIMRSFMDSVEYTRDGSRNILTMEKALSTGARE